MTITFRCPWCGGLCAFHEKNAGRRARCQRCWQGFIIPSKDGEKAKKVKDKSKAVEKPTPGFYHAVFIDSWKIFANRVSVTPFVFIAAAVCFKFLLGHLDYSLGIYSKAVQRFITIPLPAGRVVTAGAWGCLLWYYIKIIFSTAYDVDKLPELYAGGSGAFIWVIIRALFIFIFVLLAVELPLIIAVAILKSAGVEQPILFAGLFYLGLFLFPAAFLTVAVNRDITVLQRPDRVFRPVYKAFGPYMVVFGFFMAAWLLQERAVGYGTVQKESLWVISLYLAANIAVQVIMLVAARAVGLFCRHYGCYVYW